MYSFFHSAADPALDGNKINTPPVLKVPRPGDEERLAELDVKIKQVDQRLAQTVAKIKYVDPAELPNPPKPTTKETVWIEDAVPAKAVVQASGGVNSTWKFVVKPEPVYSGAKSTLLEAKGLRQVVFTGVNPPLVIEKSAKLFTYVYLDTLNPPKQIMLQFNNGNWEHRAYWGGDHINWGKVKTGSRKHMGNLPETGKWVRLEVDPVTVSLKPGEKLNGWAYTQYDGKVYWDKGGIFSTVNPAADPAYSWKIWKTQKANERNKDLNDDLRKRFKGKESAKWSETEEKELRQHWLAKVYDGAQKTLAPIKTEKVKLVAEQEAIRKNTAITFIMADLPKPRQSHVMIRGQYNQPGEKVSRNVPEFLPALPAKPKDRDYNRLDFANWLVDGKHPLTARVAVNRLWQQFFGVGLVKTSADFGTQGQLPSNPELLDWLAVQFVEDGWDIERLVTRIMTSHAYCQSSAVNRSLFEKDPENRLLARGPRYRLDAEILRDQALHLSGLMVSKVGGRGVMPYQPPNIWEPVGFASSNTRNYKQGKGEDLYRRSIYTFLKRTAPAPFMASFDAPNREQSCAVRSRTNTPMQALQLMNDIQHVEAARNLAQRILKEGGKKDDDRIRWAWRVVTARWPATEESKILQSTLDEHRIRFTKDTEAAKKLIAFGESKADPKVKAEELAAWTLTANLLLNLDEVANKN